MEKYAYIRVSCNKQIYDRQIQVLADNGYTKDNTHFYEETYTGTKKERPIFNEMLDKMNKGDTLIVESLSRIGRNLLHILETINFIINKKEINIEILKEGFHLKANGEMDSVTKLTLQIFAVFAEFERNQLSERTKEGLLSVKSKGKKVGKPSGKYTNIDNFIKTLELNINGLSQRLSCNKTLFPERTYKLWIHKYKKIYNTSENNIILEKLRRENGRRNK